MWYRFSALSMEESTRKILESLATTAVRKRLISSELIKPSEQDVTLGVRRVMKDIEREHGSITKAALSSPSANLKPIVDEIMTKIKW